METDAPYLAPVPFRGKRNQSDYEQDSEEEFTWVENPQKGKKTVKTFKHARKIPAENKTKLDLMMIKKEDIENTINNFS